METAPSLAAGPFHRYRRQILPRELAQERQVKLAERVDAGDAAKAQNVGARFAHEWEIGRVAGKFQREVSFDRSVNFTRAAIINVPAPIGQLPSHDMLSATLLKF